MLDAKADYLYNLPQWDGIFSVEKRKEIRKEWKDSKTIVKENKIGRNDPCPCGSGKKYKNVAAARQQTSKNEKFDELWCFQLHP